MYSLKLESAGVIQVYSGAQKKINPKAAGKADGVQLLRARGGAVERRGESRNNVLPLR